MAGRVFYNERQTVISIVLWLSHSLPATTADQQSVINGCRWRAFENARHATTTRFPSNGCNTIGLSWIHAVRRVTCHPAYPTYL